MTRPKRKPNTESSSGPFWPWVMGAAIGLVLLVGIGFGIGLLPGGKNPTVIAKNGKDPKGNGKGGNSSGGTGGGTGSLPNGTKTGGTADNNKTKPPVVPPTPANPKTFEFIGKNRVYLVPTTAGRYEMTGLEKRTDPLGAFFKALQEHDQKHGYFSQDNSPPTEFSPATYAIGPDPMSLISLKASQPIKYNAKGGTLADPFHYHLGKMTILMHSQNDAKKSKCIAFHFPNFAQWGQTPPPWIYVAGKTGSGIKPFYLVPLESTQPSVALINLKVGGGIQFDDAAMTAKAKPEIVSALKKLLKDNDLPQSIKFWAGAPLKKWGYAHLSRSDSINFKTAHLDERLNIAKSKAADIEGFNQTIDFALNSLFPAARDKAKAQLDLDAARNNPENVGSDEEIEERKALGRASAAATIKFHGVLNLFGQKKNDSPAGINKLLEKLTNVAKSIANGITRFEVAEETWKGNQNTEKQNADADVKKWGTPGHQKDEWNKFKLHPQFFLGTPYRKPTLPLIQFSQ